MKNVAEFVAAVKDKYGFAIDAGGCWEGLTSNSFVGNCYLDSDLTVELQFEGDSNGTTASMVANDKKFILLPLDE